MPGLPTFITSQNPWPSGHPGGEVWWDSGTGPGPPVVCNTIRGSPQNTLHCHPGPLQVSWASYWEGWPIRCLHDGGCRGGACDLPKLCREGHATGWLSRASGGAGNHCTYPQPTWRGFWAWGSHQLGDDGRCTEVVTTDTTWICRAAGYQIRVTSPWGFTGWYTPGGPARSNLFRINANDHHPEYFEGRTGILLQNQGHFQDIPAFNSAQFPIPTWPQLGTWGTMSE